MNYPCSFHQQAQPPVLVLDLALALGLSFALVGGWAWHGTARQAQAWHNEQAENKKGRNQFLERRSLAERRDADHIAPTRETTISLSTS
ncbi:hypothetical protein K456DRAFT_47851 [Colletotrichum gloeosporioides 23]|nr:hypothetical protein K456DRAFT_47851 [Colletotrichum gloeosporioides 23]